ncbi:hypothetical protein FFLO_05675 [Filobasidium floriforme]|uniref:PPIase cyclophilin-type domain-containing protein n=2 Tax=Filobasidium floriforme TaxID=5210 RepID=A0A8K0JGC6_9TREE|nr:hypothetical protein FFLO_05675 [Filobasidium floriforme]
MGEIEIELWCKETPKACRNFLALIMEGYYDNVIFHRIVPGFIAQTGDPTGTGMGGESFYGEPFENETHSRLKFNRRGLIAFANNGDKRSNTSQWFITLDRADELQNKHTLFGRVNGPTIYNVLKIANLELDKQERPLFPPKITSARIIENPYTDIVPRITAEEKRQQLAARQAANAERERLDKRKGAKKNTGLLSFGDEEDKDSGVLAGGKKKVMARPDFVDPNESAAAGRPVETYVELPESLRNIGKKPVELNRPVKKPTDSDIEGDVSGIRAKHDAEKKNTADARKAQIEEMQAKIRKLDKRRAGSDSDDSDDDAPRKKRSGPSFLDQELAKYSAGRRGKRSGKKDEDDVLSALSSFTGKIRKAGTSDAVHDEDGKEGEETRRLDDDTGGLEIDDDIGFMSHALKATKEDDAEQTRRAESDYTVIDPKAKARAIKDEKVERRRDSGRNRGHGSGRR